MQELETLLNTLIARGGKPFNLNGVTRCEIADHGIYFYEGECSVEFCSYRELVSLESGLWQFVCSQKLLSDKVDMGDYRENSYGFQDRVYDKDGFYWVMRCARIPEEELGKFLIDNIKVKGLKSEQSKR